MRRALTSTTLIWLCSCHLLCVSLAATKWSSGANLRKLNNNAAHHESTNIPVASEKSKFKAGVADENIANEKEATLARNQKLRPRLIDQYERRYDDGHYEYRYSLSNGDTRYERAYWLPVGTKLVLARKGYYSYPMPNNHYQTVFYTSDHNGFQQDLSTYSSKQPTLPRTLEVPEHVSTKPEAFDSISHEINSKPALVVSNAVSSRPKPALPKPTLTFVSSTKRPNVGVGTGGGTGWRIQRERNFIQQQPALYNKRGEILQISFRDLNRVRKNTDSNQEPIVPQANQNNYNNMVEEHQAENHLQEQTQQIATTEPPKQVTTNQNVQNIESQFITTDESEESSESTESIEEQSAEESTEQSGQLLSQESEEEPTISPSELSKLSNHQTE